MQQFIDNLVSNVQQIMSSMPLFLSVFIGMFIIVLESMIPALPLGVFIAFNMFVFGDLLGFAISWVSTIIGCILMFYIVRKLYRKYFREKVKENKTLHNLLDKIDKLSFSELVLITSLPFTPAFLINIASGLSKMEFKKFFFNILISKIVIVYFWGYIGTTFLESVTDIYVIIKLAILLTIAFILSKLVMKKQNIV